MLRLQFYFLLFLFPFKLCAQQQSYVFQHITSKDGLASDKANCIFQDSKGFYWVGTDNGLQRFDGKNFSNIPSGKDYKNGNSSMAISDPVLEDKEGNIWGCSTGFISVYHPHSGKCENIEINDDTVNSAVSDIQYFCKDEWGDIWIITKLNLYKYDYKIHTAVLWIHVFPETGKQHWNKIVYDDFKKALWIVGGSEIILADVKTKKISRPFSNNVFHQHEMPPEGAVALFMDSKQNLWFS